MFPMTGANAFFSAKEMDKLTIDTHKNKSENSIFEIDIKVTFVHTKTIWMLK